MTDTSKRLPALSIRNPYAWAIIHAGKDIENRDWPTNVRGEFYIHAAKGMSRAEYQDFEAFYNTLWRQNKSLPMLPPPAQLVKGGIVGKAKLVDCVKQHGSPWFFGKYGFVIEDAEPVEFVPYKGQLGFFDIDPAELDILREKARQS